MLFAVAKITCNENSFGKLTNGPLTRYVKLRVAHAPGMPERFPHNRLQTKPLVSDPGMHHGTCVTRAVMHVGSANPRWRETRSRNSRRTRKRQFCVSGKRPIDVAHPDTISNDGQVQRPTHRRKYIRMSLMLSMVNFTSGVTFCYIHGTNNRY